MEQFLAFAGNRFYPKGGIKDFIGSSDNLKAAKNAVDKKLEGCFDVWGHVVDSWDGMGILSEEYAYEVKR